MSRSQGCPKLLKLASRHPLPSPWWYRPDYADPDYSRRFYLVYGKDSVRSELEQSFFDESIHSGQTLLDIGCGGGEFARTMARKGVRVTGIDLGPFPIEQAIEQTRKLGIQCEWIQGDFFKHEFADRFDWITLLGTQLQEFPPEELDALFGKSASLLKNEGKLICCAQRFEPSEREYSSYWYLPEHCLYTDKKALVLGENFYYPEERIRVLREYALEIQTGRVLSGGSTEKEYAPEELDQASAARGLKRTAAYGDFDRSEWTPESPRLIAIFEKA